ncbi:seed maturation [Olea europaea subsp. europaea]|uniref:Seed maturation n=1 Tax=Olea europaea subsp. europaea TaxID=158383 RepID=A0A8S0QDC2_OLEEU|nr:seed maturation [Olea europaea subsp. europaea]
MSGAQGALPPGSYTATTYESTETGENKTKLDVHSKEDEGGIQIDKLQDKVEDAAGEGGPVFGAGAGEEEQEKKDDLGVTGTA